MFCINCGKEVKDGVKFCTNCGAKVEAKKTPKKEEKKADDKLTYSQNKAIETTSNPTPVKPVTTENTGDGKGTASLILGIVSFVVPCVGFITSIVGLILGICAKKSGKKTAGIILNSIALGLIVIAWVFLYTLGYVAEWTENYSTSSPSITTPSTRNNNKKRTTYAGSKFEFDGFELAIGNNYDIITIDNTSSSHYGEEVIKLPVAVTNVSASGDHLNMYYYEYYAPSGEEIDSVRNDFGSLADAIDYVHVDSGETVNQYFYILYKGDGKYKIKFDNYKEEKTVEFSIKK